MTSIHVLAPKALKDRLQRLADKDNRPLSGYVRNLLQEMIDRLENDDKRRQQIETAKAGRK